MKKSTFTRAMALTLSTFTVVGSVFAFNVTANDETTLPSQVTEATEAAAPAESGVCYGKKGDRECRKLYLDGDKECDRVCATDENGEVTECTGEVRENKRDRLNKADEITDVSGENEEVTECSGVVRENKRDRANKAEEIEDVSDENEEDEDFIGPVREGKRDRDCGNTCVTDESGVVTDCTGVVREGKRDRNGKSDEVTDVSGESEAVTDFTGAVREGKRDRDCDKTCVTDESGVVTDCTGAVREGKRDRNGKSDEITDVSGESEAVTDSSEAEVNENGKQYGKRARRGDINGNGDIDSNDYLQIRRSLTRTCRLDDDAKANADIDGNGVIDVTDCVLVKRHLVRTYVIAD